MNGESLPDENGWAVVGIRLTCLQNSYYAGDPVAIFVISITSGCVFFVNGEDEGRMGAISLFSLLLCQKQQHNSTAFVGIGKLATSGCITSGQCEDRPGDRERRNAFSAG